EPAHRGVRDPEPGLAGPGCPDLEVVRSGCPWVSWHDRRFVTDGRRRELARADRVLPGLWRLRLPLPWPGVPHVNAFAIAAGDGVVLVDTGLDEPGAMQQLELGLAEAGLRLEHIRLLVCTHAHSDHYGLAGPIVHAAGCELWMHPNQGHMTRAAGDPEQMLERRIEVARHTCVQAHAVARDEAQRRDMAGRVAE